MNSAARSETMLWRGCTGGREAAVCSSGGVGGTTVDAGVRERKDGPAQGTAVGDGLWPNVPANVASGSDAGDIESANDSASAAAMENRGGGVYESMSTGVRAEGKAVRTLVALFGEGGMRKGAG